MNLLFATQNKSKAIEIQMMMPGGFAVKSLQDVDCDDDIPETGKTLEENALIKVRYVYQKFGVDCFADDTGLEVDALNGKPGVLSARYAGEEKSAEANMNLILNQLKNTSNRNAKFRTVIALIVNGTEILFEGIVNGIILEEKSGQKGFGYDPIFKPNESTKTFAEMSLDEKNKISHRGRALAKLVSWLKTVN
ncbi:MAG: non-canonical purine NTP diphosphatase [Crocinitomicaceae bacterium]|nr:non-canonical purine NTP diphosphatase [Crocinitomicaceae bacterium]MBK8926130.1 non-canonical purine NTP diphosphatase [Crocinitomicaceae bacterium]